MSAAPSLTWKPKLISTRPAAPWVKTVMFVREGPGLMCQAPPPEKLAPNVGPFTLMVRLEVVRMGVSVVWLFSGVSDGIGSITGAVDPTVAGAVDDNCSTVTGCEATVGGVGVALLDEHETRRVTAAATSASRPLGQGSLARL